jgi:5-methylcytosine-specific restriction endonuclease McrA
MISKGQKPRRGIVKVCPVCTESFYVSQSCAKRNVCGRKCRVVQQRTNDPIRCAVCRKEFYVSKSQQRLRNRTCCSRKCRAVLQRTGVSDPGRKMYYAKHKETYAQRGRAWRKAHPDRFKAMMRRHRQKPSAKLKHRLNVSRRRAMIREGNVSIEFVGQMLEEQGGLCKMCGVNVRSGYELDHIIPISKGGKHSTDNLQILCRSCNRRKSAKILSCVNSAGND